MKKHYLNSSYREKLIEHIFVSELLKLAWQNETCSLEISKPEVDCKGYDIIIEENGVIRHIQLKTSVSGAKTAVQKVHVSLGEKPSGCIVWVVFDEQTLSLGPFRFFGGLPNEPLPCLAEMKVAKHTKANSEGVKAERPEHRVVPKGQFVECQTVEQIYAQLFSR